MDEIIALLPPDTRPFARRAEDDLGVVYHVQPSDLAVLRAAYPDGLVSVNPTALDGAHLLVLYLDGSAGEMVAMSAVLACEVEHFRALGLTPPKR